MCLKHPLKLQLLIHTVVYLDMIQKTLQNYLMINPSAKTDKCFKALKDYRLQKTDWSPPFVKESHFSAFSTKDETESSTITAEKVIRICYTEIFFIFNGKMNNKSQFYYSLYIIFINVVIIVKMPQCSIKGVVDYRNSLSRI